MVKPVSFLQFDKRWATIDYSAVGEKTTIGGSGCGPTSAAMVIATYKDASITPKESCVWSLANKFKAPNQGTYYSFFKAFFAKYDIDCRMINSSSIYKSAKASTYHKEALAAVKAGHMVICCMGPGNWTKSGHFILWYGFDGTDVLINDPNSTKPGRIKADLGDMQEQVKYYFIVKVAHMEPLGGDDDMDDLTVKKIIAADKAGVRNTPSDFAKDAVPWAVKAGILSDTKLVDGTVTKEELAAAMMRFAKFIGKV